MRALALATAFRALASTWRFEVEGEAHHAAASQGPFVYALWHHTLVPLLWWHRQRAITLVVSRHRDGALLADAAAGLGYRLARGSSTRGGLSAFRAALRDLSAGHAIAITPDGPAGPARQVKPGVLRAARQAGVPILPVSAWTEDAWRLHSWDRLVVPRPFARVRVRYGSLLRPDTVDDPHLARLVAAALDRLDGRCQEAA